MKLGYTVRLALMPIVFAAHPLHTSLAEINYDPAAKEMRISIRVFIDDLTKASNAYAMSHKGSVRTPIVDYARAAFVVADRGGHALTLIPCGAKPVGDLMWLCFRTPAPSGIAGFQVAHKVLFDLYNDQINIVQATYSGKKTSLLFTRGEGFKRL